MHLGLIGGIGPAATAYYHRGLIRRLAATGAPLTLTIVHADAATLLRNQAADAVEAQAALFAGLIERLARAGAERAAVTSIAGHFCIEALKPISALPLVDLVETTAAGLRARGLGRVGLLGTERVMGSGFYGGLGPVTTIAPQGPARAAVHEAYAAMATAGRCLPAQRETFFAAGRALTADGAEAILLGGTDLFLAFEGADPGFPTLECADLHLDALAAIAAA